MKTPGVSVGGMEEGPILEDIFSNKKIPILKGFPTCPY